VKKYYNNCATWPDRDVHCPGGLVDMIGEAREVTRRTFLKHVDPHWLRVVESRLGYTGRGSLPTMAQDYHVTYHRSKHHGRRVYYFRHSSIEYVFK